MLAEAIDQLAIKPDGYYVDGTFGRGGHSKAILKKLNADARLLVIDKDPEALAAANDLAAQDSRVLIRHGSFAELEGYCQALQVENKVDGVLLDLGVSSPQLDDPLRGFSFSHDGPLDMRMDTSQGLSAREWINSADEQEIANVIYEFGEERFSRRMARAVVIARQKEAIESTGQLAEIIKEANPAWEKYKHPATRAFQGIRIFINSELKDLDEGLKAACKVLKVKGRLVVISFHSLEDRKVKRFIQFEEKGGDLPKGLPIVHADIGQRMKRVGKPVKAGESELENNVRARSAVMRVAEKVSDK